MQARRRCSDPACFCVSSVFSKNDQVPFENRSLDWKPVFFKQVLIRFEQGTILVIWKIRLILPYFLQSELILYIYRRRAIKNLYGG